MARFKVDNVGSAGVVLDVPPDTLPPQVWSSGQNVRFRNNKAQAFSGATYVSDSPQTTPAFWLVPWQVTGGARWIYASASQVWYTTGQTSVNITRYTTTPGDNDYSAGTYPKWSGGILNGVPVLNNSGGVDYPQQWDSALGRLRDLSNWPTNTYAKVIRPFKTMLIALGVNKAGADYPYLVKWSHPADPGTVPPSWDETDPTRLAGEYPLAQTQGKLVDCAPLGGLNVVYKEDSVWLMQPTGGLDVFAWREASAAQGLLAARCVKTFKRIHFAVGLNDIYIFDGNRPESVLNKRMRKWFFSQLSTDWWNYTFVVPNYPKQEMWVCFVESGATAPYATKALVWSWVDGTWSIRELPNVAHIGYGVLNTQAKTIDELTFPVDDWPGAIDSGGTSPATQKLVGVTDSGTRFGVFDEAGTDLGTDRLVYLERLALPMTGQTPDPGYLKFVRAVYPKVAARPGTTLRVYVGAQERLDGPITWNGPNAFVVDSDTRVDVSVQGRYIAVRFEGELSSQWELSGYELDFDVVAEV